MKKLFLALGMLLGRLSVKLIRMGGIDPDAYKPNPIYPPGTTPLDEETGKALVRALVERGDFHERDGTVVCSKCGGPQD